MGAAPRTLVGPLTPREIEELLSDLPARERASLEWALAGIKQAINLLHEGSLTEATILQAAKKYAAAMGPLSELGATVAAKEPGAAGEMVQDRLRELGPMVREYLGATEHAARLARTLCAMFVVGAFALRELAAHPEHAGRVLDQAFEVDVASLEGTGIRASVLVAAVLDGIEREIPVEHVQALIERADLEGWIIARVLASEDLPGGPIPVPGYAVGAPTAPSFKTELARKLWEQRRRVVAEGGTLTDAEVEGEVAARRGGAAGEC